MSFYIENSWGEYLSVLTDSPDALSYCLGLGLHKDEAGADTQLTPLRSPSEVGCSQLWPVGDDILPVEL